MHSSAHSVRPLLELVRPLVIGCLLAVSTGAAAQWTWTPETGRFVNVNAMPKETPELQVEFARSLLLSGRYGNALDETQKFEKFYSSSDWADDNQFLRGEILFAQGDYVDASEEFQQVVTRYPATQLYDSVIRKQYEIGDAMFERGQTKAAAREAKSAWQLGFFRYPFHRRHYKRAIDVYSMVIDNQPFTPEAAEAQYKVARCHYVRHEYSEAAYEYRRVLEDYQGSPWVSHAGYGLARSYAELSYDPEYDQGPSRLAIEAVEDFAVSHPDDPRREELETLSAEMFEKIAQQRLRTARFYERRQKIDSARLYYEITAGRFPGTEAADRAQRWLDKHPNIDRMRPAFVGPAVKR